MGVLNAKFPSSSSSSSSSIVTSPSPKIPPLKIRPHRSHHYRRKKLCHRLKKRQPSPQNNQWDGYASFSAIIRLCHALTEKRTSCIGFRQKPVHFRVKKRFLLE